MTSPFVACVIAYKFHNATEIHLFGVDLVTHPVFSPESLRRIKLHFKNLKQALAKKRVDLIVYGSGLLKDL
jgi:hypothetical protein